MILIFVRHGDPIYHPDSLTPLGKRQAEAVAKRIALYGIDRLFSSTSNRAIQTAQPTSELTEKEIELLDFCNEKYAGDEFSVPNEAGKKQWVFQQSRMMKLFVGREIQELGKLWYEYPEFKDYKFKQGVERMNRETDAFLLSLGYEHIREEGIYKPINPTEDRIALFAHHGFGVSFLSSLLDIPYPKVSLNFDIGHTGMTVIEFKNTDGFVIPKVLTLSNDAHLYKENIPMYHYKPLRF